MNNYNYGPDYEDDSHHYNGHECCCAECVRMAHEIDCATESMQDLVEQFTSDKPLDLRLISACLMNLGDYLNVDVPSNLKLHKIGG